MKSSHFKVLTARIKTLPHQRRLNRFAILNIGSIKKLVTRGEEKIKYHILTEKLYDVIGAAHGAVGQGGRDRLLADTALKYANVINQVFI